MNNLLSIEKTLLNQFDSSNAWISELSEARTEYSNAHKTKFYASVKIAKQIPLAEKWFKSQDTKDAMEDLGISWSKSDMQRKLFNMGRSNYSKLKKISKILKDNPNKLEEFMDYVKGFEEDNGFSPSISVPNFTFFAEMNLLIEETQDIEEEIDETDGQNGELDESSDEVQSFIEEERANNTLCSFTFRDEMNGNPNISFRIEKVVMDSEDGLIISSGEKARIKEVMQNIINLYL